ncbi:hypothetical protein [Nodosilinea sp. FACHB-13]|uniref:hypothetical protein n=1 Tax=Nodosilinea sp. FACHB-13 TaxID=2692831 RepID=UPI0019B51661|nr:hypothetical protein [Nodosilinea sp. FACHB-13]MBD2108074.1 hypothetical protein [Nodosilinea sp. FACHB-13]
MTSIATLTGLVQVALKLGAARETRSSTTLAALGALPPLTLVMPGLFTYIAWMNRAIAKFLSRFSSSPLAPARLLDQKLRQRNIP